MSAILRRFQVSVTSTFVLEIGNLGDSAGTGYIRFFSNATQIELSGEPYELEAPWLEEDLLHLQLIQLNDVMYICHPDYPVHKLTREADTDWTLEEVDFDEPPFLDENLTSTTITPSGTTGSITLTASVDIFQPEHVGAYWRIGHLREANTLSHDIDADESSSTIPVFGDYTLRSYGTWTATLEFQQSFDAGATWETVHKVVGKSDQNLEIKGTVDQECLMRVTVSGFSVGTDARATIETQDAVIYGFVQITAVGSGGSATATVKESLYATTATDLWAEGAWSEYRGYPRACTLHEQRMCFGGTAYQPSTIWGSCIDDFENFATGDSDSDAYSFTLAGLELNAVQWMASLKALLVGTTGSEWRVIGDELGAPITATKVSAKQFSYEGSEHYQAENTGKAVLFIGRKGKILWEVLPEGDSFTVTDLTLLAPHLTEPGTLAQVAWQRDARILWCVTTDGRLLGCTYNREQAVLGWHTHATSGFFRSVATIYGDATAADEVWLNVERIVSAATVFYVERLNPASWSAREDYFGVDSGLTYEGTPDGDFGGLTHLIGRTVVALADGVVYENLVVDAHGQVSLPTGITAGTVHIGLNFTSLLTPFRLDADTQLGVHLAQTKVIDELALRVFRSAGITYYFNEGTVSAYKAKDGQETTGLFGASEAEDLPLTLRTGHTPDPQLTIQQASPLPLSVLAIRASYRVSES